MSLTTALHTTYYGLTNTESRLDVVASNITNADKTGYTRKTYETEYITTSTGTVPVSGTSVTDSYDDYLYASLVEDASEAGYYEVLSDYLTNLSSNLGGTDSETTLNSALDDLASSLDSLSATSDDSSLKTQVVQDAEMIAYEIRNLSSAVQDLRAQADQEIETLVGTVNDLLVEIDDLNEAISQSEVSDISSADLEDDRRVALQELSALINVDYYLDDNNQMKIYCGGVTLVDSAAKELTYSSTNMVNSSVTYPGTFSAIEINGTDVTSIITSGKIGSLIELRDETLVEEQDKLDEFATTLMEELNSLLNEGTSYPGRTEMISDVSGFALTDAITGTGSFHIATLDEDGVVLAEADIDLTLVATVDDLITAINGAGVNVTASLTSNGELVLTADNSGETIAMDQDDSDISSSSFSSYFGLNNLFSGTGAENIYVSDYLSDNADYLATASMDSSVTVGDTAIYSGDGDLSKEMNNLFTTYVSFDAAGNFAATTATLDTYADKIMSNIANRADDADNTYETVLSLYEETETSLSNLSGVNIDEELSRVVELESKYQAQATLVTTIRGLFDDLLTAVS